MVLSHLSYVHFYKFHNVQFFLEFSNVFILSWEYNMGCPYPNVSSLPLRACGVIASHLVFESWIHHTSLYFLCPSPSPIFSFVLLECTSCILNYKLFRDVAFYHVRLHSSQSHSFYLISRQIQTYSSSVTNKEETKNIFILGYK